MKAIPSIFGVVATIAIASASVQAAEIPTPPTDEELTLRPGDTITWSPSNPHRIRFGGTVVHKGNMITLPPFGMVNPVPDVAAEQLRGESATGMYVLTTNSPSGLITGLKMTCSP